MTNRTVAIFCWLGILLAVEGGLALWLGPPGAVFVPVSSGLLNIFGVTPERVLSLARHVGAIWPWELP